MRVGRDRFLTQPGRLKYSWDLVLRQVEASALPGEPQVLVEGTYNMLLEQIEFERDAYRADTLYMYGQIHREMHEKRSKQADWPAVRAEHWNNFRATVRSHRQWLDEVEQRLDEAFLVSQRQRLE